MNNKELIKKVTELIGGYQWKQPENIANAEQVVAASDLSWC